MHIIIRSVVDYTKHHYYYLHIWGLSCLTFMKKHRYESHAGLIHFQMITAVDNVVHVVMQSDDSKLEVGFCPYTLTTLGMQGFIYNLGSCAQIMMHVDG